MSNSKFIQVASSVLVEYIYSDPNESSNFFIESQVPLYKYKDSIFNGIINENKGTYYTGNSINRTFENFGDNQISLLRAKSLNQYDYLLDASDNNQMLYDSIRIHFISGFNFENNRGFIFNVKCLDGKSSTINLLNFALTKSDSFENLNPNPFYFANKYYTSYIEVKVLSLYQLIYSHYFTDPQLVSLITANNGIKKDQYIQCHFSWISEIESTSTSEICTLFDSFSFDLELVDKYSNITASINVSLTGNYFEYGGLYKGINIGDFINNMNSAGYDYIMLHDIVLYESGELIGDDPVWSKTQELQLSQTSNFSTLNIWRPIIKSAATTAFKVDYVLRLFNRNDQSQIWKVASIMVTGDDVSKFGTYNSAINISSPIIHKIYNKNVIKEVKLIKPVDNNLFTTKQIFTYINSDISLSVDSNDKIGTIKSSGLSQILITENITKLKFTLYKKVDSNNIPLSFTNYDTLFLNFKLNDSSNLKIEEVKSLDFNRNSGEVLFKINSSDATKILSSKNRNFEIIWKNSAGEITTIGTGSFYSTLEWSDLKMYSKLTNMNDQITNLGKENANLVKDYNDLNDLKNRIISDKDSKIATLTSQISEINSSDSDKINSLQLLINSLKNEIDTNNRNYKESLALLTNKIVVNEQVVDDKPIIIQQPHTTAIEEDLSKLNASIYSDKKVIKYENTDTDTKIIQ